MAMKFSDYLGFTSMTLLLIGAVNWGTVAIRYAIGDLPSPHGVDKYLEYKEAPVPDLLDLFKASPDVQMFIYWTVFGAGIVYLLLFIWNSIEVRTEEA